MPKTIVKRITGKKTKMIAGVQEVSCNIYWYHIGEKLLQDQEARECLEDGSQNIHYNRTSS